MSYISIIRLKTDDPTLSGYLTKAEMAVTAIQKQIEFARVYENIGLHSPAWQHLSVIIAAIDDSLLPIRSECDTISIYADPMFE